VYIDPKRIEEMTAAQKAIVDTSMQYDKELERTGHYVAAEALQSPRTATTVRVTSSGVSVTDGPFAETKEHLGGFILIEAKDKEEAVAIAAKIPLARAQVARIEVRPVMDFSQP
jgi:hypothetical protein